SRRRPNGSSGRAVSVPRQNGVPHGGALPGRAARESEAEGEGRPSQEILLRSSGRTASGPAPRLGRREAPGAAQEQAPIAGSISAPLHGLPGDDLDDRGHRNPSLLGA